jgi:mRNA interferase MazF
MVEYIPDQGDLVWLEFDPQAGNEISKTRPALVISPAKYNQKTSLALFMPVTSQVKGYPFEFILKDKIIQGAVLCDQIRSLDWKARKARKIATLDKTSLKQIITKFKLLIEH